MQRHRQRFASWIVGALAVFGFAASGVAVTLVYEPFDYEGADLDGQPTSSSAIGLAAGGTWTGANTSPTLSEDGVSLSVTGFTAGIGSRVSRADPANGSLYRDIDLALQLSEDHVLYVSFLLQKNSNGFVELRLFGSSDRVYIASNSNNNLNVGLQTAGGKISSATGNNFLSLGTTYLIVAKIVTYADPLVSDEIYASAYASGDTIDTTEPASWDVFLTSGAASSFTDTVDTIRLYMAAATNPQQVDEVRIGTDWESILSTVAVPEPASLLLMSFALATLARRVKTYR